MAVYPSVVDSAIDWVHLLLRFLVVVQDEENFGGQACMLYFKCAGNRKLVFLHPGRLYIRNTNLPLPVSWVMTAASTGCFKYNVVQSKISKIFLFCFLLWHPFQPLAGFLSSVRSCSKWGLMEWWSLRKWKLMISVLREGKRKGTFYDVLY